MKTRSETKILLSLLMATSGFGCARLLDKLNDQVVEGVFESDASVTIPAQAPGRPGLPGASVPTGDGVVSRISQALEGTVQPTANNFQAAVNQYGKSLPACTNPRKCQGGPTALVAYAACADAPLNAFGVTSTNIAGARASLISAGVRIVNNCMGGLANAAPYSTAVQAEFTSLVDANATLPNQSVRISFNSVCMAATTFCALYRGF